MPGSQELKLGHKDIFSTTASVGLSFYFKSSAGRRYWEGLVDGLDWKERDRLQWLPVREK